MGETALPITAFPLALLLPLRLSSGQVSSERAKILEETRKAEDESRVAKEEMDRVMPELTAAQKAVECLDSRLIAEVRLSASSLLAPRSSPPLHCTCGVGGAVKVEATKYPF